MSEQFELRRIHQGSLAQTLDRAHHYRLLNDPEQAESICLDVLEVDPSNQRAIVILVLALTDSFSRDAGTRGVTRARELIGMLEGSYEQAYYSGLIAERMGRAYLAREASGSFAYESLREAMGWYEKAEAVRPPGNDDPLLRWNSCARTIMRERLEPRDEAGEQPLE
jgi:hypothetical protein